MEYSKNQMNKGGWRLLIFLIMLLGCATIPYVIVWLLFQIPNYFDVDMLLVNRLAVPILFVAGAMWSSVINEELYANG